MVLLEFFFFDFLHTLITMSLVFHNFTGVIAATLTATVGTLSAVQSRPSIGPIIKARTADHSTSNRVRHIGPRTYKNGHKATKHDISASNRFELFPTSSIWVPLTHKNNSRLEMLEKNHETGTKIGNAVEGLLFFQKEGPKQRKRTDGSWVRNMHLTKNCQIWVFWILLASNREFQIITTWNYAFGWWVHEIMP